MPNKHHWWIGASANLSDVDLSNYILIKDHPKPKNIVNKPKINEDPKDALLKEYL